MAEAYLNIDKQTLDLIKYPPLYPPEVEYISDYNYSANNLRGKLFQFCYRYKYDTKMKSVFSPYSELLIPQGEELPNGDFTPDFHLNNSISIRVNHGHASVEAIEVAYRIGNNGDLYVFDTLLKTDAVEETGDVNGYVTTGSNVITDVGHLHARRPESILPENLKVGMRLSNPNNEPCDIEGAYIISIDVPNRTVYLNRAITVDSTRWGIDRLPITRIKIDNYGKYSIFRNDKVDYPVPTEEATDSFDAVPLTARSMEVIESNRIMLGGPLRGFDNVEQMEISKEVLFQEKVEYLSKFDFEKHKFISYNDGSQIIFIKFPTSFNINDYIYINMLFDDDFIITADYLVREGYLVSEIINSFIAQFAKYVYGDNIDPQDVFNRVGRISPVTTNVNPLSYVNWNPSHDYGPGHLVYFNNRLYMAGGSGSLINPPAGASPSGTTADNTYWEYICESSDIPNVLGIQKAANIKIITDLGVSIYTGMSIYSKFKDGVPVNLAIEYFDYAGRLGAANHNSQLEINIPRIDELPSLYSFNNLTNSIKLTISHKPPEWAMGYRILMDRNVPWFQQFFFYGPAHTSGTGPDITDDNIHWRIKVNRAIQNLRDYFPKSIVEPYIFEKGDRIRMLAYQISDDINSDNNQWRKYNTLIDSEIIGYDYEELAETYLKDDDDEWIRDADGNKVRDVSTGFIIVEKRALNDEQIKYESDGHTKRKDINPLDDAIHIVYEIYRPRKSTDQNTLFYETHRTFAVGLPGEPQRYHYDPDFPWSTTQAEITLTSGNVYRKMRYSGEADIYFPVESLHASDYYESDSISIGRENIISEDLGQVDEEDVIVGSGTIIEGTAINRLNKFPSQYRWQLQSKHGPIWALLEKGFILYAWQGTKVTSLYVGRNSMIDPADGSERVTLDSKAVIGTIRPDMSSNFGCVDQSTISSSGTHVYFWDRNNSKWCRIAYNGIFPVSDYGMNKFFSDLNSLMKQTSKQRSISVYDQKYDELVVSHKYMTPNDYNVTIDGLYTVGDNKFTEVGRHNVTQVTDLEEGMVLTNLISSYETPEINLVILKVDVENRTIYFDQPIPFATGITGSMVITADVIKKYSINTVAFHEPVNGWKTRYPFPPELMVAYGDQLLSFLNGRPYLHGVDSVPYNYFYGIQFEQYFQFVFNTEAGMVKLLEGIEYIATKKYGAIAKGDITIKSFDARGMDMESKLPTAKFKNVEGKWVSELLRDMNTPGIASENYALTDGRFLRGQAGIIKFTTFEVGKTEFYEVSIYFNQSL